MSRSPVEEIKAKLSILDVVGQYVELKHAGKSYKGKSPFTNEKTPSFYVSPDRGVFYCFSSQKGGDMFTFVQEMEGVDFKGALKILAEKAHVELVPEDPKMRDEREAQYALLEETARYFFETRASFPHVDSYLEERGVKMNSIISWRIGYARDEWRALRTHLKEKGFTDTQMFKAGVIKGADQGKEPYDVFRDRIMFPIMDASGRVVAFSGRTLKKETGIPKYVNSPETEFFQKSEILHGYDKARHGIRQYDFSLVVEGQFDLVLAHQVGYTNAVAVSGTALTPHHIALLTRLSQNVVLALDADRAGISAVKRSAVPMLTAGMNVKVAQMTEGKDPADLVREDPALLRRCIGGALHVIEFLLEVLKQHTKDERTYKLRVREELLPLIVSIENRIDREHFESIVAQSIQTTKDAVHYEVERITETRTGTHVKHPEDVVPEPVPKYADTDRSITQRQMVRTQLAAYEIVLKERSPHVAQDLLRQLTRIDDVLGDMYVPEEIRGVEGQVFLLEEAVAEQKEKHIIEEVQDLLTRYAHLVARERLGALRVRIGDAESRNDHEATLALLEESKEAQLLLQTVIEIGKA